VNIIGNLQVHTRMKFLVLVPIINCPENAPVLYSEFGYQ